MPDQNKLDEYISLFGMEVVLNQLSKLDKESSNNVLTIVTNNGPHRIPEDLVKGELFVASMGDFKLDDAIQTKTQYEEVLKGLSVKLKEKKWRKIYLLPFGPTSLNMLIKLIVYRVTYSDTTDYIYSGNGKYVELAINSRTVIL